MSSLDPSKLTPAQLAQALKGPAQIPPPGVTPNFIDPVTRAPMALGLGLAILLIMWCFTLARMFSKAVIARSFNAEDCKLHAMSMGAREMS